MNRNGKLMIASMVVVAAMGATALFAAALTANLDTPERAGQVIELTQASNHIYAGSMVCENGSAVVVPARDASGYMVVGRAEVESDNTGSGYNSALTIPVKRGVFRWANGGSFTDANIGDLAYVLDDQTVFTAALATNDVVAGVIVDVDSSGVWVDTYAIGGQGAASVAALTATGAADLQSTLAVGGAITASSTLALTGAATLTGGITGGRSLTNTFYTVPAGTANAITNTLVTRQGITTSGTSL